MRFAAARFLGSLLCVAAMAASRGPLGAQSPAAEKVRMCGVENLSLSTDGEDGNLAGMQQNGTLLVLRNLGPEACRLQPFPQLALRGAKEPFTARFEVDGAVGMHPGPVVFPVVVAAGAEVTTTLRWIEGPVWAQNACVTPKLLVVTVAGKEMVTDFGQGICGEKGREMKVFMTRWKTDPVWTPGS